MKYNQETGQRKTISWNAGGWAYDRSGYAPENKNTVNNCGNNSDSVMSYLSRAVVLVGYIRVDCDRRDVGKGLTGIRSGMIWKQKNYNNDEVRTKWLNEPMPTLLVFIGLHLQNGKQGWNLYPINYPWLWKIEDAEQEENRKLKIERGNWEMGSIYQRGKIFWIKYYRNGTRSPESSKSTTKAVQ